MKLFKQIKEKLKRKLHTRSYRVIYYDFRGDRCSIYLDAVSAEEAEKLGALFGTVDNVIPCE